MKTTFIGLGAMGLPMARHLLQAGYKLTVYNRTRARADALKHLNPIIADTAAAAARGADVLITMVADDAALETVLLGEQGALAALKPGAIHVSMSTIGAGTARWLAERHGTAGQTYVAAPVSGDRRRRRRNSSGSWPRVPRRRSSVAARCSTRSVRG